MKALACGLTVIFAVAGLFSGAQAQAPVPVRVEIPIKEVVLSDGTRRYTIPIMVGQVAIEAGLDTGSTGLRVLPGVLSASDAASSERADTYSYGSGAQLAGVVGKGVFAIGGLSGPTQIQLVSAVRCTAEKPQCPVSRVSVKDYGVQGDGLPGQGFKAIIGVNMANADVPNPLMGIGVKRWIVDLPRPGEHGGGRLILNPTDGEAAEYVRFPIDARFSDLRGGLHDAVSGCFINDATQQNFCGPLVMDTGAPGLRVVSPGGGRAWPNGTPATLAFIQDGKPRLGSKFEVGRRDQASAFRVEEEPRAPQTRLFSGLLPYFAFSVLYDPAAAQVGLKPRSGGAASAP